MWAFTAPQRKPRRTSVLRPTPSHRRPPPPRATRRSANRLVGILHGCLRHHTPYDEHTAWGHRGLNRRLTPSRRGMSRSIPEHSNNNVPEHQRRIAADRRLGLVCLGVTSQTHRGEAAAPATLGSGDWSRRVWEEGVRWTDEMPRTGSESTPTYRELQRRLGEVGDIAAAIESYRPRVTDVVVTPSAKCGTTWLEQIFPPSPYDGDTDFDDISHVGAIDQRARFVGVDLEAPHRAEPRGFKSHLIDTVVPKPARFIVAGRGTQGPRSSRCSGSSTDGSVEPGTVRHRGVRRAVGSRTKVRDGDYWSHLVELVGPAQTGEHVLLLSL